MMVSRRYLFGLALVSLACARELTESHGLLRRTQEDIPHAGIGAVRGICDPLVTECASNDMQIKEEIAAVLGSKSHVAGESYALSKRNQYHTTRVLEHHRLLYAASCLERSLPCLDYILLRWARVHMQLFIHTSSLENSVFRACCSCGWIMFFFWACDAPPPCLLANLEVRMTLARSQIRVVFNSLLRNTYSCHGCRVFSSSFRRVSF